MTDIVRLLDNYFQTQDINFVVGRNAVKNLFDPNAELEPTKVSFFCDPFKRTPKLSNTGAVQSIANTSTFVICVPADFDQHYFNEKGVSATSKYTENIEPLVATLQTFVKDMNCNGYDIEFDYTDVTNFLDANFDGLIGNIKITQYE